MKNSAIEWTHHTFNSWWGCTAVSPACKHCYAELTAKRHGHRVWGVGSPRRRLSDNHWAEPLRWNAASAASGVRQRVFCASMADVFEDRRDLAPERARLWALIAATPHLDWLLLTKRIHLVEQLVPWGLDWPGNVWIGTTVEDQRRAAERLPILVEIPAVVRFLSAEPLLDGLDLRPWLPRIDWLIAGGESGPGARPSSPSWFADLRDQCLAARTRFFFKQWGNYAPAREGGPRRKRSVQAEDCTAMVNVGKKAAGRLLDGREWNQMPVPRTR